jgi:D-amino-acid oxidase
VSSDTRQYNTTSRTLPNSSHPASFLILGAGVTGLTTALELRSRHPTSKITIAAKYLPGDSAPEYASAWGGANWFPASRDNGRQQDWDTTTYKKFGQISKTNPESGIEAMRIRFHYEKPIEEVGILTPAVGKLWFEELVGGLEVIRSEELPEGTVFGFEMASFVINVQMYLPWCVWLAGDLHVLVFC